MTKRERLIEYINGMNEDEMVELHNNYCEAAGYENDRIYSMEELDEVLEGRTPADILQRAFYGEFNPNASFFWLNGYANLCSASWASESPIYASDIANYILTNEDALGNDEIQDMLGADFEGN